MAVVAVSCAALDSPGPVGGSDAARSQAMPDDREQVLAWVRKAPFDDIRLNAASPGFSYDEWFKEGRALPRAVDILAGILEAENLDKPSADGMRIAYALGWIGDRRPQVVEALTRALKSRNVALRMEAISALGRLGEPSVVAVFEQLLADPAEDINVRGNACIALGRLGDPGSEPLLRRTEQSDNVFLSACAKEALRLFQEARRVR